ncbi:MAG: capsule biosynthesis protein [Pseudomonadota bacterium]
MSTKPKARKFRIKRDDVTTAKAADSQPLGVPEDHEAESLFAPPTDDGFGARTFPSRERDPQLGQAPAANELEAIKGEGLTGRQLRMARRVAQRQGLQPSSDFDAVRQLRAKGIDPFKRANMLELVLSDTQADANAEQSSAAPQPTPAVAPAATPAMSPGRALSPAVQKPQLPSTEVANGSDQAMEVMKIQRDIAKRRRRRAMLLAVRLFVFVLLPTFVAGFYFYRVATPMYATNSEFVIQAADSQGGGGGLGGGLLSGSPLSSSQDSITVQGYLQSRDAMLRLDADEGFRDHFSEPSIDPIQRLDPDATQEAAYKKFASSVKIGYDPTEGIIKMEVIAADPATSAQFSKQLIQYAEEQVDQLTARKRGDQMEGADQSRKEAEQKMIDAQVRIVELQEKLGVLSPESEVQAVFGQITQLESELLTERISLQQFLANQRPNEAKVSASQNKIAELEKLIDEKRAQLTESNSNSGSLARISGELLVAQADLEVRQGLLAQAEAAFEAARLEANRQVRYLSVAVSPVAPDEPTYPRKFENTILAFLIFAGVYLMVSLTSSILREQV